MHRHHVRTPQQRDRGFTRVRRTTQSVLVASGLATGSLVGYAASTAKPLVASVHPSQSSSSTGDAATSATTSSSRAPTFAPPTSAPVTTTTTCYTTPSGSTVCY